MTEADKLAEKISFLGDKGLSDFSTWLNYVRDNKILDVPKDEFERVFGAIKKAGKLILNEKIYGFHIEDSWAYTQSDDGEGLGLYLRHGNVLEDYLVAHSDFVYSVKEAIAFLKKKKVSKIYTGEIPVGSEFLEVPQEFDKDYPVVHSKLTEYEIQDFQSADIDVLVLDPLI